MATINGTTGNDTLNSTNENDTINGLAGTDTAVFTGNRANYTIVDNGGGSLSVTDTVGTDGTDTLTSIEQLQFADTTVQTDDFAATITTTGAVTIGGAPVDGHIERPGDHDFFKVELEAGKVYVFDMAADTSSSLTLSDAHLTLRDASGNLLRSDDDSGYGSDSRIIFEPETSGTYFLDAFEHGDGRSEDDIGTYQINARVIDSLNGTAGDDTLNGTNGPDFLTGRDGNDVINGLLSDDRIFGGSGNDTIDGGAGVDRVEGGSGNDILRGGEGVDTIYGGSGDDTLSGDDGSDHLFGGVGNDTFIIGGTNHVRTGDSIDGGAGIDTADLSGDTGGRYEVNLETEISIEHDSSGGTSYFSHLSLRNVENVIGTSFDDILIGDANANMLNGGAGNDQISGGSGDDILEGGAGSDTIDGGAGNDTASYAGSSVAVYADLGNNVYVAGDAQGDTLTSIENLTGSAHADTLSGNAEANNVKGGGGTDELRGAGGDDVLEGGASNDFLDGGTGSDTASYSGSGAGVNVNLATNAVSGGDAAGDLLVSIENATGSAHADTLTGSAGANTLTGGAGDDVIEGSAGADNMIGGAGIDTLSYASSSAGVQIEFSHETELGGLTLVRPSSAAGGDAQGDTFHGFENITGSAFNDTLKGSHGANIIEGGAGADTLDGGDGIDTASYANSSAGVRVSFKDKQYTGGDAEGDTLSGFENIVGSNHADYLQGSAAINVLYGGNGNDTFLGHAADDTIYGGEGDDRIVGDSSLGSLISSQGTGNDTLHGGLGNDHIQGDGGDDVVFGGEGDDLIWGDYGNEIATRAGQAGNDTLNGGAGNDTILGDSGNDILRGGQGADALDGGAGIDGAYYDTSDAGVTVNLGANTASGGHAQGDTLTGIENLTGSTHNDTLTGNAEANVIKGGVGADTMIGGNGNDFYYVDNVGDTFTELAGEGIGDYIFSSISLTIGANFERLYLEGSENINATGLDGQADLLMGNAGNNIIDGKDGADYMRGGLGNDFYYVDDAGDAVDEVNGGGGIGDYIFSTVSYAATTGIERLYLQGSGDINATGADGQSDLLLGNSGNNVFDGKDGADYMRGGLGNDFYYVDDAGDTVDEVNGGGGIADYIFSTVSYTIAAGAERLYLTSTEPGITYGIGRNDQNDLLVGGTGSNALLGNLGNDLLIGGGGVDYFRFNTALDGVNNVDRIYDFSSADDQFQLEDAIFTGMSVGILSAAGFETGAVANDADDRIIYDSASGAIYYDSDGNGAAAQIQFATVNAGTALDESDFQIF